MRSSAWPRVAVAICLGLAACSSSDPSSNDDSGLAPMPPTGTGRGCPQSVQGELSPRWKESAVKVGTLWLVATRSSVPDGDNGERTAPLAFLKMLLILEPGSEARLAIAPEQLGVARLLYRADRSSADVRVLSDGEPVAYLVACPDRLTQFSGGVVVTGVRRLKLWILAGGTRQNVVLSLG